MAMKPFCARKTAASGRPSAWTQLGSHVADVSRGLATIGFGAGDVACVLAETQPDYVYVDLGILDVGGVSGGIHPATEPEQLGEALQQCRCSVLFVENEEQLDKALLVRDRCPELQRIIIFDMKGLREFSDATCESYRAFIARGAEHRTELYRSHHRGSAGYPAATARQAAHARRRAASARPRAVRCFNHASATSALHCCRCAA